MMCVNTCYQATHLLDVQGKITDSSLLGIHLALSHLATHRIVIEFKRWQGEQIQQTNLVPKYSPTIPALNNLHIQTQGLISVQNNTSYSPHTYFPLGFISKDTAFAFSRIPHANQAPPIHDFSLRCTAWSTFVSGKSTVVAYQKILFANTLIE